MRYWANLRTRGATLGTTLVVAAIALMLALTIATGSIAHLQVGTHMDNALQAHNLAEATLSKAIERVLASNGSFGKQPSDDVTVVFPQCPGQGTLTFDPADDAFSTYNLKSDQPKVGFLNRNVPPETIHLVALGSCGGVTRRMEAVLAIPTFRYSVLNSGGLVSHGSMLVGGVAAGDDPMQAIADDKLLPGHIASNSTMELTPGSAAQKIVVKGDARAGATIDLGTSPKATVEGATQPGSSALEIPRLVLEDFDPTQLGATHDIQHLGEPTSRAQGLVKHIGDVTVQKLRLGDPGQGSILWVQGDLTVTDGVEGTGVIISTGTLDLRGISNVQATQTVALMAHDKVRIEGTSPVSSAFQGVVYSGARVNEAGNAGTGGVELSNVTVVGSVVGNGDDPMTLTNANMVHSDDKIEFEFDLPFKGGNGQDVTAFMGMKVDIHIAGELGDYYDPNSDSFPHVYSGNPDDPNNSIQKSDLVADVWLNGVQQATIPLDEFGATYTPGTQVYIDAITGPSLNALTNDLGKIDAFYQKWKDEDPSDKGKFTLDPNRFLQFSQKTRVVLWRDF